MKKYEYKFVQVPYKAGFRTKAAETFESCKEIIINEAGNGWRLKQIVVPFNEKIGVYGASSYEVIFEREME